MGEILTVLPLLAQTNEMEALKGVRQGFVQQAFETNILGIVATAIGLCLLALVIDRLWRHRQRRNEPKQVDYLTTAGRLLGLSLAEIELLRSVGVRARLAHPPAMLLSPSNLHYALLAAQRAGEDAKLAERVGKLSRQIFGT
jgi:hypothetical protein